MRLRRAARLVLPAAILFVSMALFPRRAGPPDIGRVYIRAIAQIRAIHSAQAQYFSEHGQYAGDLGKLEIPQPDSATGYRFSLAGGGAGYAISAIPQDSRTRGRSFYSDQTMAIREHRGPRPAAATDSESK